MGELPDYPNEIDRATAPAPADASDRLNELEIKTAYIEDLLDTLNTQVARQQDLIDTLVRELRRLRERQENPETDQAPRSLRDELPPHY